MTEQSPYRFYGRRQGKKRSARQQHLLDDVLPRFRADPADPTEGCAGDTPVWLEIGFGGAEHLVGQAVANPDVRLIGCEPFLEGVVKALDGIEAAALRNVRIHDEDVRPLLDQLPDACIDRVFILFPDPWPKTRHHKRRIVSDTTLDSLARVMRPGAMLRIATDHMGYGRWILFHVLRHPAFRWTADSVRDWLDVPPDHVTTRYQSKLLAGSTPLFLAFDRCQTGGAREEG
ncbi:MAG: tRNA (guanine(46)-N(7))-methyltransferase TrmB [Minwuia sp.]|nr:tRNA (guanine(46)-N(7))-methyltransferase TrmB [Minwuia sp.]